MADAEGPGTPLVGTYRVRVTSPPCHPGSERWIATAELGADITPVLPYLNARLRGAAYDHPGRVLIWQTGGRRVSFRPQEIAVSNLEDRTEAEVLVQRMVGLVNRIWSRRDHITPSTVRRQPLKAMDIYRLLPQKNCKECGFPTCFTFALAVTAGSCSFHKCPLLAVPDYAQQRARLLELYAAAGLAA